MNDTRLRLLTWDNVAFIFCIMKKDRLTYFHYDVMNAFLERTWTDERVNKDHLYKLPEICKIDDMVKEFLWKKWEKDDKIRKMNIIEEQKNKINILKKWWLIN